MKTYDLGVHKSSIADSNAGFVAVSAYFIAGICSFIPVVKYFAFLVPLILFFVEKDSKLVKFSAIQAFFVSIVATIFVFISLVIGLVMGVASVASLSFIDGVVAGFFVILSIIVPFILFVLQIYLAYQAYCYKAVALPLVGHLSARLSKIDSEE